MTVREVTYYEVACNWPACDKKTGDHGLVTAWSDRGSAEADWQNLGHVVNADHTHYCKHHDVCEGCGKPCPDDPDFADRDFLCPACFDDPIPYSPAPLGGAQL